MALPTPYNFITQTISAYTPSAGATPVAAYASAPFRGRLLKVRGVLGGAITTANGTITIAVNGTTVGSFTVTQSGSAAGSSFGVVLASPVYLNEDDVISLTPSGASGSTIPMHFHLTIRGA